MSKPISYFEPSVRTITRSSCGFIPFFVNTAPRKRFLGIINEYFGFCSSTNSRPAVVTRNQHCMCAQKDHLFTAAHLNRSSEVITATSSSFEDDLLTSSKKAARRSSSALEGADSVTCGFGFAGPRTFGRAIVLRGSGVDGFSSSGAAGFSFSVSETLAGQILSKSETSRSIWCF